MQRISLIKATLLLLYSDGTQWIFQLNELTEQKKPPMQLLNLKDLAEATIEVERNNNAIKSFNKGYSSYTSSRWNKNKDFNKSIEKKLLDKAIPRYPPNNESNHYSNTNSRAGQSSVFYTWGVPVLHQGCSRPAKVGQDNPSCAWAMPRLL
ncbi:hypothetical protein FXO38_33977 [Capsicum annuum]|nr:hypothetical protein FXO38_33977 [Capsicum annuum]